MPQGQAATVAGTEHGTELAKSHKAVRLYMKIATSKLQPSTVHIAHTGLRGQLTGAPLYHNPAQPLKNQIKFPEYSTYSIHRMYLVSAEILPLGRLF